MNVLLINVNTPSYASRGELTDSFMAISKAFFLKDHVVAESQIASGDWVVDEEINKLKQADLIVYHFPLWWFGVPNLLKKYLDEVLLYGEVFEGSSVYGEGGLLKDKKALFVVSTNISKKDLSEASLLADYETVDDLLCQLILTNEYVGIRDRLDTFHAENVIQGETEHLPENYLNHLKKMFT